MLFSAVFILIMMLVNYSIAKKHAARLRDESEIEQDEALREVLIKTANKKEKQAKIAGWVAVIVPGAMFIFAALLFSDVFYY